MTTPTFRPKYVSFDCYGTLISWPMTPITKELVGDQVPAEKWDQFVAEFRGYRYDAVLDQRDDYVAGVIDFGDTVRSAVIFDPAVAVANLLGRRPEQPWREAYAFVAGYESVRPIKDRELPLLPVAALARLTLRALITNWRAERVPERRDYLLSHAKDDWSNVQRSLAVPMADVIAQLRTGRAAVDPLREPGSVGS